MKLLINRSQKEMGILFWRSIKFIYKARVILSAEEKEQIKKYKMGNTVVYADGRFIEGAEQMQEYGSMRRGLWNALTGLSITIDELVDGKKIVCADIVEAIAVRQKIITASKQVKLTLDAAVNFDGGETIEM